MNYRQVQQIRKLANTFGDPGVIPDPSAYGPEQTIPGQSPVPGNAPPMPAPAIKPPTQITGSPFGGNSTTQNAQPAPQQTTPHQPAQQSGWWTGMQNWLLPIGMGFLGTLNALRGGGGSGMDQGVKKQLAEARTDLAYMQQQSNWGTRMQRT